MENEHTLYGKGAYGVNVWKIHSEGDTIVIHANGQTYTEQITEGKGGKTIPQQVHQRVTARVRSKLDSGFKPSREETRGPITNQLGLMAPMLATPLKSARNIKFTGAFIQPKFDGHRMLVTDERLAYSRRGKPIKTVREILAALPNIPKGMVLDGELYCHGEKLQTIASWAKRRQRDTLNLQYHVYDIIAEGIPFTERLAIIGGLGLNTDFTRLVETSPYDQRISPERYTGYYRNLGYEGAILRPGGGLYEVGKRSQTLVKLKQRFDEEFLVIGCEPSKNMEQTVLWLETFEGKPFKVVAPGTHHESRDVMLNPDKYLRRYVTVEYAELTEDGIPFHAVATRWRKDI